MEFETEWGDRERKRYLLSDLVEILNGVRPHTREWLTAVLTEISSARYLTDLTTDELFSRYDSLNVGPLRTEVLGTFACLDQSEAFAKIKHAVTFGDENLNGRACFPDILLPFDTTALLIETSTSSVHKAIAYIHV